VKPLLAGLETDLDRVLFKADSRPAYVSTAALSSRLDQIASGTNSFLPPD